MAYRLNDAADDPKGDFGSAAIDLSGRSKIALCYRYQMPSVTNNDDILFTYGFFANNGFDVVADSALAGWYGYVNEGGATYTERHAAAIAASTWVAETFVIDRSLGGGLELYELYRNGSLVGLTTGNAGDTTGNFSNNTLYIGSRENATRFQRMSISDFGIMPDFTPADHALYAAGRRLDNGMSTYPLNYWPLTINGVARIGGVDITFTGGAAVDDPPGLDALVAPALIGRRVRVYEF